MADAEEPPPRPTQAQRAQQKRETKLAELQAEIDAGRVTVRQMTDEEKAAFEKSRDARVQRRRGAGGR